MSNELCRLRKTIDILDAELIKILGQRMRIIPLVAKHKKEKGVARYQPGREQEVINSVRMMSKHFGLNPDLAEAIMKLVIADAHRIEREIIGE